MDKSTIRKEIAALIDSIKEHSDSIGNGDHIPQLELELILSKIEKLYKKAIILNHLNSFGDISVDPPEKKPLVTTKISDLKPLQVKETAVPAEKNPVDLFGGTLPPEKQKTEKKPERKEERKEEKKPERTALKNLQKPPITDLKAEIGINDKFLFANELFGGVLQEYEIAVQQLNSAGSLESAMDYFISLQPLYNWDMESEPVKRLLELIDRRYS